MTPIHSKSSRVYLDDADLSGNTSSISLPAARVLNDKSSFSDTGRTFINGISEDKIQWEGHWSDTVDESDEELQGSLGVEKVSTFWHGGDAISAIGYGTPTAIARNYRTSSRLADLVIARAEFESNAVLERTKSLQAKDASAITANEDGTSIDDAASSSSGGAWYYHAFTVTASGGNAKWVLHLQDSANNSTWADVDTVDVTGQTSGRRTFAGTLDRYVRQQRILDATSGTLISHISYVRS